MMMCSCRSKSKVVFLEVSRYEGQLPRVDGVEVGLPRMAARDGAPSTPIALARRTRGSCAGDY